ncbi:Ger(x)C family spore germination protein [Paenibacillus sp. 1011MAR3C5]|uniref:Ger(x)C family spore germination protein n=1 Tax=Paenibacillus sp. 1011MAR3C5 TaxID=1675787 RepID=UPI000E6C84E9|nr:Ger(x)C family spore germination protein [Paenibacillus sp. 1011MAR3C5]RJE88695.1 Ger(x)C family spore germination protein [Paenibacillus sp. 1011MAR3C5]
MRKSLSAALTLALCAMALSGCWSASDVESKSFAKALGIDYENNEFVVYTQMLDFSNIAKSDTGGKGTVDPTSYIGHGRGSTLNNAINNMYRTAQIPITWGHVSAVILTERALKSKGIKMIDMLNRYPELRYNLWIYATKDPVEKLLTTFSLYKMSSLYTILHNPLPNYKQYSVIKPIEMFRYIADYNEPALTASLPIIGLNEEMWKEEQDPMHMLSMTGIYYIGTNGDMAFIRYAKLNGHHWMQKGMNRAPLTVEKDGIEYANLSIGRPEIVIKPIVEGNEVYYDISLKLIGAMYEYNEPLNYSEMVQIAEDTVEKQIRSVFQEGVKHGIDIFNLGQSLWKKDVKEWKRLSQNGAKIVVHAHAIRNLQVKLSIPYNGKYKRISTPLPKQERALQRENASGDSSD